jgi:hypothetical protein
MVPWREFWQTWRRMQNVLDPSAESPLSPRSAQNPAVPDPLAGPSAPAQPLEIGGPSGPEPTRFGDWEKKGRCIDF